MTETSLGLSSQLSKPLNVEETVKKAQDYDYDSSIPLRYWLRSAGTLLKEAQIYEHEGNDQQTYLLLYRHAQLILRHLSEHPEAKESQYRSALAYATLDVNRNLQKLELLRPRINKRSERYEQLLAARDARQALEDPSNSPASSVVPPSDKPRLGSSSLDSAFIPDTEILHAGDHKALAVRLAHDEIGRRAVARKATRQAGISQEVEQGRRTAGLWRDWEDQWSRGDEGDWEEQSSKGDERADRVGLSTHVQDIRPWVKETEKSYIANSHNQEAYPKREAVYRYPAIPENGHAGPETASSGNGTSQRIDTSWRDKSCSPDAQSSTMPGAQIPARPAKEPLYPRAANSLQVVEHDKIAKKELKPSSTIFKPSAYLENGNPLRTIFLPPELRHRFMSLARSKTEANLETCGILCGTLISNALFISKLVVPDQESTSDTCEMVNENDLFDYVDGEDLMVLGWIHTHPTQTCFMSSRDLHTHSGYQVMMPESIAIVCAPSKGEWGVFRLTDPPGMMTILRCTQKGIFHPHSADNIYTDALRPGHVYETSGLDFEVVDLRSE